MWSALVFISSPLLFSVILHFSFNFCLFKVLVPFLPEVPSDYSNVVLLCFPITLVHWNIHIIQCVLDRDITRMIPGVENRFDSVKGSIVGKKRVVVYNKVSYIRNKRSLWLFIPRQCGFLLCFLFMLKVIKINKTSKW